MRPFQIMTRMIRFAPMALFVLSSAELLGQDLEPAVDAKPIPRRFVDPLPGVLAGLQKELVAAQTNKARILIADRAVQAIDENPSSPHVGRTALFAARLHYNYGRAAHRSTGRDLLINVLQSNGPFEASLEISLRVELAKYRARDGMAALAAGYLADAEHVADNVIAGAIATKHPAGMSDQDRGLQLLSEVCRAKDEIWAQMSLSNVRADALADCAAKIGQVANSASLTDPRRRYWLIASAEHWVRSGDLYDRFLDAPSDALDAYNAGMVVLAALAPGDPRLDQVYFGLDWRARVVSTADPYMRVADLLGLITAFATEDWIASAVTSLAPALPMAERLAVYDGLFTLLTEAQRTAIGSKLFITTFAYALDRASQDSLALFEYFHVGEAETSEPVAQTAFEAGTAFGSELAETTQEAAYASAQCPVMDMLEAYYPMPM
jgi:hypothetical protein